MQDPATLDSGGTRGNDSQRERMSLLVRPAIAGLLLLITLLGLVGTAIRDPRPHDIPVGLVGPAAAVQQISSAFAANAPGAFQFTSYGSEAEARAALDLRTIDGALVLGGSTPVLIVAGAAGDATTGVITAAFTNVFKAQGGTINIEVVHPFAAGDAHGLILFFVVVAVIISTMVAQALLFVVAIGAGFAARLAVVLVYALLAGLVGMGMATWIAGDYGSGFWTATFVVMLASAAVGAAVAGAARLLGLPGLGLSALIVVLLDLVSSGGPVGSQLLPDFYRSLAPWMPAGEMYDALRGALYFDGAALARPIAVLSSWLVGGIVLMLLGGLVSRRRHRVAATVAPAA